MNLDVFMFFHKHTIKCPQSYSDEICVMYTDFSGNVSLEPHNLRESVVKVGWKILSIDHSYEAP